MGQTWWSLGQEFRGLGHVEIFTGRAEEIISYPAGQQRVEIGRGVITGCTKNNDGNDSISIAIYLNKVEYGLLTKLFSSVRVDKLMTDVVKFISKQESKLKAYYGASKVDINYSWRP